MDKKPNLAKIARELGLNYKSVWWRYRNGKPLDAPKWGGHPEKIKQAWRKRKAGLSLTQEEDKWIG